MRRLLMGIVVAVAVSLVAIVSMSAAGGPAKTAPTWSVQLSAVPADAVSGPETPLKNGVDGVNASVVYNRATQFNGAHTAFILRLTRSYVPGSVMPYLGFNLGFHHNAEIDPVMGGDWGARCSYPAFNTDGTLTKTLASIEPPDEVGLGTTSCILTFLNGGRHPQVTTVDGVGPLIFSPYDLAVVRLWTPNFDVTQMQDGATATVSGTMHIAVTRSLSGNFTCPGVDQANGDGPVTIIVSRLGDTWTTLVRSEGLEISEDQSIQVYSARGKPAGCTGKSPFSTTTALFDATFTWIRQ